LKSLFFSTALLFAAQPAFAQEAQQLMLRQGTPITMALQEGLSSKTTKVGQRFQLKTSDPVKVNGIVVIPVGTPGTGEVTKVVKKGAFGKSGKLETRLLYVRVGDESIALTGTSNEAGEGGTGATVAVAVIAGVFSAFVTGTSAEYPVGAIMTGFVATDQPMLAVAAPAPMVVPVSAPAPVAIQAAPAVPASGEATPK
jgi:hypothetical protein